MTITSQETYVEKVGDGVTVDFTFNFPILSIDDIDVYIDNTIQSESSYNVVEAPVGTNGGTVTFVTAPADGAIVRIERNMEITQERSYPPYDPFPAKSHEEALDKLTMLIQQVEYSVSSGFRAMGAWMPNTTYQTYNIVLYDNNYYIAISTFTSGATFDPINWNLLLDVDDVYQARDDAEAAALEAAKSEGNAAISAQQSANCAAASYEANLSAQGYSTAAEHWAQYAENVPVPEGDGTEFSAYHWAQKAAVIVNGGVYGVTGILPITVDNTDPAYPVVGFDGTGLDLSGLYLGQGLAYQLGTGVNLDNVVLAGMYTWTTSPIGINVDAATMFVSINSSGDVSQIVFQASTGRAFTRRYDGVWSGWFEVGPDPYVNEYGSANVAGLSFRPLDVRTLDTLYLYGFDRDINLEIAAYLDEGRTIAISLDTVQTYNITWNVNLRWPDSTQNAGSTTGAPAYSATGINVVTITRFGGDRYIANLSANH